MQRKLKVISLKTIDKIGFNHQPTKEFDSLVLIRSYPEVLSYVTEVFSTQINPRSKTKEKEQVLCKIFVKLLLDTNATTNNIFFQHFAKLVDNTREDEKALIADFFVKDIIKSLGKIINQKDLFTKEHFKLILEKILACQCIIINNQNYLETIKSKSEPVFNPKHKTIKHFHEIYKKSVLKGHNLNNDFNKKLVASELSTMLVYKNLENIINSKEQLEFPQGKFTVEEQFYLKGYNNSTIKVCVLKSVGEPKIAYITFRGTFLKNKIDFLGNLRSDISLFGPGVYELLKQIMPDFSLKSHKEENAFFANNPNLHEKIAQKIIELNQLDFEQISTNSPLLQTLIKLKKEGYQVIATGHSLGGAFACNCKLILPKLIDEAFARSAPGVSGFWINVINQLKEKKFSLNHEDVKHYDNYGDMIPGFQGKYGKYYSVSSIEAKSAEDVEHITIKKVIPNFFAGIKAHRMPRLLTPLSFIYYNEDVAEPKLRNNGLNQRKFLTTVRKFLRF